MSLKFSMIFTEKAQLVVTCHHAGNFIETHVSFRRLLREAALAAAVTHRQQRSLGVRCLSNNEREREREREYVVCLSFVLFVHCTYFKVTLLFGV